METKIVLQRHTKLGRISACARSALIARAEFGPVVTCRVKVRTTVHQTMFAVLHTFLSNQHTVWLRHDPILLYIFSEITSSAPQDNIDRNNVHVPSMIRPGKNCGEIIASKSLFLRTRSISYDITISHTMETDRAQAEIMFPSTVLSVTS